MYTETIKERDAMAAQPVHPQNVTGTHNTGTIDASQYHRVSFVGIVGTIGASAVIQARLQETNEANGANATNVANAAIVNIATANTKFTIEVPSLNLTKRYVRGQIEANVASNFALIPFGTVARNKPVTDFDTANTQRVVA